MFLPTAIHPDELMLWIRVWTHLLDSLEFVLRAALLFRFLVHLQLDVRQLRVGLI